MQLFLDIVFQLSVFAVNILLPLSLALIIVGSALAHRGILKSAFFSGVAVAVFYLIILGVQIKQIADSGTALTDVFANVQGVIGLVLTIVLPIIIGIVVAIVSSRRFKKIA